MMTSKAIADALFANDLAEFQRLLQAHPENLRSEKGKDIWLWMAANLGKLDFVKFLVSLGIDVNETDDSGLNGPVYCAAYEGHLDVVRWLLDHGAKINLHKEGRNWCSTLTTACHSGHFDVVKLLVERGADVNALGPGLTPLSYALMYGKTEIADYLRSVGAKLPWQVAPRNIPAGHKAILKHFAKYRGQPGPLALQEIVPSDPSVAIHVVPPSKKWPMQTLFTVGMSDRSIAFSDGSGEFAELVVYLPPEWPLDDKALADPRNFWPIDWLRRIAMFPHQGGAWPGGPSIIFANDEPPRPLAENTQLTCLMCIHGKSAFDQLQLPDYRPVNIYSLYALYTEERDLEKEKGTEHLVQLFENHGINRYIDLNRPNVALLSEPDLEQLPPTRKEEKKKGKKRK